MVLSKDRAQRVLVKRERLLSFKDTHQYAHPRFCCLGVQRLPELPENIGGPNQEDKQRGPN